MDDTPVVVRALTIAAPGRGDPIREISDWLIGEGRFSTDNAELFTRFCERVVGLGVPIDRASLHLRALHPQYRGVSRIWRPGQPLDERFLDHGIEKTATYRDSPVRVVVEEKKRLEWLLDRADPLPYPVLEELRADGYTHYVAAPVLYASGMVSALSWATRYPGGFGVEDLRLFDEILQVYTTLVEVKALPRYMDRMLTTYVGR